MAPGPVPPDDVATRAFALFLARGYTHGHDMEDWLKAERELRTEGAVP